MSTDNYIRCPKCNVYHKPEKQHHCLKPMSEATNPVLATNPTSSSIDSILLERQKRYKDFKDNAEVAQQIKAILCTRNEWHDLSNVHKEAIEIIVQKISRIVCGDPNYLDNWVDIQGYAKLAQDRCES